MGVVTVTAWRCDFPSCGHVWYTAMERARCAKCKRKNWNKSGGDVIKAPKTRKKRAPAKPATPPGHITKGNVIVNLDLETMAPGWEKPIASVTILNDGTGYTSPPLRLPTIVHAPVAERFQAALKHIAEPEHKIGEKCPHGWANWLQCEKCNPKLGDQ